MIILSILLFFFNDTATTEIYTLSLHDALPICLPQAVAGRGQIAVGVIGQSSTLVAAYGLDRKSTRLNSSHTVISYAVFCLKKKKRLIREHVGDSSIHARNKSEPAALTVPSRGL